MAYLSRLFYFMLFFSLLNSITFAQTLVIHSNKLPRADTILIVTPKNYSQENAKKFPLVFMLHGWSGNYKQWSEIIDLQEQADKYGFILVCPDGLYDSWYLNSPKLKNQQYANFFFQDLLPQLSKKYRIDDKNIFITGLSMGGYGAFSLFLQQPDLFKSVAATSALFDLRLFAKRFGLPKILGNFDKQSEQKSDNKANSWETYSIITQLKAWKSKDKLINKSIYFDCGKADAFLESNIDFEKTCKNLGIQSIFVSTDGNHSQSYWQKTIITHFEFFSKLVN